MLAAAETRRAGPDDGPSVGGTMRGETAGWRMRPGATPGLSVLPDVRAVPCE
ncbi:hypothetical protein [Nocardiopsis ansamitocini]|uniref:hypothetical protein n=1 Tax=Nocardiopsis ansamitocini TaxID=1670832 RepID=UPI0025573E54|nr:hypothetical protein [Nocardiopsis ansamitocini]